MRQQEIHYLQLLYIQLTTLFCDWPKAYSEFFESAPEASSSCILYNNHVKVTQGDGQLCRFSALSGILICIFLHVYK